MKYLVIGGAGFIGSNVVKRLHNEEKEAEIYIYDNFSSGKEEHLQEISGSKRLHIIQGDVKDFQQFSASVIGKDIVYSFVSNPDISKAVEQPDIDFWEGTYLINNVLEAMRQNNVKNLIYASGSGVYGDVGSTETDEDFSPLLPSSTYGASKLACEAMICSYCKMFGLNAAAFRFANVVGPNQTHGVGYDFLHRLLEEPSYLKILGDGTQSKSYIYIEDVIDALRIVEEKALQGYNYYNVATTDYMTVTEIADMVVDILGLHSTHYHYEGGDRGWKGDVPIVRLNSEKIRKLGWTNKYSTPEAMKLSITAMYEKRRKG